MLREIGLTLLVTVTPVSELRGGIPLGIYLGLDPVLTFVLAVVANAAVFFLVFLVLRLLYDRLLCRWPLFVRYLESARRRGKPLVDKHGVWGLALFVAVPLPVTGVYTGTIIAWLLGIKQREAFPAIAVGTLIAGVIVMLVTLGVVHGWDILATAPNLPL